jgi:hypothetical protein
VRSRVEQEKIMDAQDRKESQERETLKFKYFLVHKWNFIREKKQMYQQMCIEKQRSRQYKRRWADIILAQQVLRVTYEKFAAQRMLEK